MSVRKMQLLSKSFCLTASLSQACVLLSGDVELNPGPIDVMKTTKVSKKDCCLKTIHVNARSLIRHHDDLLSLVSASKFDVIAISESWLDTSIADSEVAIFLLV